MLEGVVASIQPYGAFVTLPDNMSGLLHISQISHDRVSSVEQVLQMGQKLKVRELLHATTPLLFMAATPCVGGALCGPIMAVI